MLKELETAKVLPVRILQKMINDRFIALVEGMLQVVQSNDQPGWQTRTANVLYEQRAELLVEE